MGRPARKVSTMTDYVKPTATLRTDWDVFVFDGMANVWRENGAPGDVPIHFEWQQTRAQREAERQGPVDGG
jgi:hypothetical protein